MKYYIIEQQPGNLEIIKVQAIDDANFLEDYGQYILASGDSIAEALQSFGAINYHARQ